MNAEDYMREALKLAGMAFDEGEAPVGAIIVRDGEVVGCGRNSREKTSQTIGHAEIAAISQANKRLGSWRLTGCDIYVTLEPCPMCAGAIIGARLSRVYYGASDDKAGACGGVINLFEEDFGHRPKIYGGILAGECSKLLSVFFRDLRDIQLGVEK